MGEVIAGLVGLLIGVTIGVIMLAQRLRRLRQEHADRLEADRDAAEAEIERLTAERLAAAHADLEVVVERDRQQIAGARAELHEAELKLERREAKLSTREETLSDHEANLDRKMDALDRRDIKLRELEGSVEKRLLALDARTAQLAHQAQQVEENLAAISGFSREEAREELLRRLDATLVEEQSKRIARHEKDYSARAKELGIEIIGRAIQRYAAEHTAESAATKVKIADEELKGRIIGKDGRNIKAFEQATGVDLIIDETPGVITISCFSGLRREIARRCLEALLEDGRIHPARIEEALLKVQQEVDREVVKLGEDAAYACDVSGLHPQLIKLLGKLHWRTSYGQNVLKHTQEVAFLCGAMAGDLGLDPKLGRRCGLLHDIGKAIDHEQEGSHPQLGFEALKRWGENEIVANAALAHHEGHEVLSAYTTLAAAADAISAARPGARSENVERYIKRLEQLEDIACSFKGISKAYAIQAGRELRVIVNGHALQDVELAKLARDIARRIEDEVAYPGEVKVTLIREMRQVAVAR
ncbi:MAG: ribonuclease Y [Planctomycetes bacterium]|nr:ribonuclease Y [Planctomycetota bacterium]